MKDGQLGTFYQCAHLVLQVTMQLTNFDAVLLYGKIYDIYLQNVT